MGVTLFSLSRRGIRVRIGQNKHFLIQFHDFVLPIADLIAFLVELVILLGF